MYTVQCDLYCKGSTETFMTEIEPDARSNIPSNILLLITGQSNLPPSNVPVMGGCWGRDEHPLLKGLCEGEDETGGEVDECICGRCLLSKSDADLGVLLSDLYDYIISCVTFEGYTAI